MDAVGYARLVADYLPAPTPESAALLAAAQQLDDAVRNGEAQLVAAAKASWATAYDAVRTQLRDAILSAVPLAEVRRAVGELTAARSLRVEADLGPLHVALHSPTVRLGTGDGFIELGPLPPDAFTARLDAGPLRGGGTLLRQDDGVSGVLTADVGVAQVAALGSLRRLPDGSPSFLAILSAGFTPGLQVGFGFQVNRIGGVVGIERRLDRDALARRLSDGSATAVLFPLDITTNGRRTLEAAEQLFPPSPGSAVAGPTFRLAWLEVAGTGFASVDLGILLELPGPRAIALVGVFRAGIDPVVQLRADFAGVVDLAQQRATVDAALVDSGVLGVFRVYGDLAFATSWGPTPYTVLSLGGFYPGFNPEPAQIRPLSRLGMAPTVSLPGMRMRAEGYLAATSNTLQLGGRLDIGVDAGIASLSGFVGVDTLVQFSPFHLTAQLAAGLDVRFLGQTFCGVAFHGTLDGPGPMTLHGTLTVETFFKDFDFDKTFVFGTPHPPQELPERRALTLVLDQVAATNVSAAGGADAFVALAPVERAGSHAVVAPTGGVEWRQHVVPLGTAVDRVAGVPLGSVQTVGAQAAAAALSAAEVRDRFAPGSFITLTAAESLNGPTYDDLPAGLRLHGDRHHGEATDAGPTMNVMVKVKGQPTLGDGPSQGLLPFAGAVLAMVAERDRPPVVASRLVAVAVTPPTWVSTAGTTHPSSTEAFLAARASGAVALAAADAARPVTLAGV